MARKMKIRNDIVFNEDDLPVATMTDLAQEKDRKAIELGSEIVPAVKEFIDNVNSGKFHPRKEVKKLESIISKHE